MIQSAALIAMAKAAWAVHMEEDESAPAWDDLHESAHEQLCDEARAAFTALCEGMGFKEEFRSFPTAAEPPVPIRHRRLASRWRPVEGEDPK